MEYVSLGSCSYNQRRQPMSLVLNESDGVVGTVKQADIPNRGSGLAAVPVAI